MQPQKLQVTGRSRSGGYAVTKALCRDERAGWDVATAHEIAIQETKTATRKDLMGTGIASPLECQL